MRRVSHETISEAWPHLGPVLERALDKGHGERTLDDLRGECENGESQLWVHGKSALITELIDYPRYKVARMLVCAGEMCDIKEAWPDILNWSKDNGCKAIEVCGRRGWIKALGLEEAYTAGRMEI